ncbi:hypothetical protein Ahy_B04g071278 isoform D [Arachis hypogaea]|uniref:Uncharacterized protein n=1 Tax=Arachis hypogaea TaxID=3818 RepID=A0A444ZKE5_ARAHY|nr:hypothetical protein Ahy_B04g071278 isoform D [Arachis hypogaea]
MNALSLTSRNVILLLIPELCRSIYTLSMFLLSKGMIIENNFIVFCILMKTMQVIDDEMLSCQRLLVHSEIFETLCN